MYSTGYFGLLTALLLPLIFIFIPATPKASRKTVPWYDLLLAAGAFAGPFVIFVFAEDIEVKGWSLMAPTWAFLTGLMTWLLFLEAVRRTTSLLMMMVIAVVSFYPLFAYMLPGIFTAAKYSLRDITLFYYMTDSGMWGMVMGVFAHLVIGYMVFSSALQELGAGRFFINLAVALLGRFRGGPAKVSVVSSALFATVSGSPIANVVTTGTFTIPAMKRAGYPAYYAGAVEACASTGGTLTPPVMGTVAFIMADFLRVSYATVCLAAAIPALLYYVAIYAQTDFYAAKHRLRGLGSEETPPLGKTLKEGWHFIFALAVLIYFIWMRMTAQAPFYATAAVIVLCLVRKTTWPSRQAWKKFIDSSIRLSSELLAIIAGVGLILGAFGITGLAHGAADLLTKLAGGNVPLLLLLGASASFVMGMGMSVSACYIFLAVLLCPALISNGVEPIAAHLFVLYWAMISNITPPVALAVFPACVLAGSTVWRTGWQAVRLGFVGFVVPFLWTYEPALVAVGSVSAMILHTLTAIAGIALLSAMIEGYFLFVGEIGWIRRLMFGIVGVDFLLPHQSLLWLAVGIAATIALILSGRLVQKRPRPSAVTQ